MNNKFIPIISVFMTISLVVFTAMQFYWLKGYYSALEQEFSNKVYSALEVSTKKISDIEIDKYLNKDLDQFQKDITSNGTQPTLTTIQQVEDSANRRSITYYKNYVEKQQIPISQKGDSLKLTKMYTDEALTKIRKNPNVPKELTATLNQSIDNGEFALREFAKLNASNLPISKRVAPKILDSIVSNELKLRGINTSFGYSIFDKNNKPTEIINKTYSENSKMTNYSYPLFTDNKEHTLFTLSLVFPRKDYSLAKNNLPMLLGTFLSLLTILGIYIISINYMMRQKKLAEIKTDFINNMSHEFKTPLATISVATDSLANDKIATNPEKVKYYSHLIKQENMRMKNQVENVLNMSKLERNEVKLFLSELNIDDIIKKITSSFSLIVAQRNGTLTQEFSAERNKLKIDEFHFSNMLVNLLDNANKYSPDAPEITVRTKNDGSNWYVIEISDKGMGLEGQNKSKIFEKFFREETGNIHNVKGQGLGLSYVKKIVELHKGQILVESIKGKGTTFIIKLPIH